jgi:hypothetical protein
MSQKVDGPMGPVSLNSFSSRQCIEDYTLPSRSLAYTVSKDQLLFKDGVIQISAMTVAEEKVMVSNAKGANPSSKLAKLINRTCDLKGMDAKELLVQDVHAILFKLRSISYGNIYPFKFTCPSCKAESDNGIDLDTHPVTYAKDDFEDVVELEMPMCKSKIKARRFRLKDEGGKSQDSASMMFEMLSRAVVEIDGTPPATSYTAEAWLNNLLVRDRAALTRAINEGDNFGLQSTTSITCPSCDHVEEGVNIPFGVDFFRAEV